MTRMGCMPDNATPALWYGLAHAELLDAADEDFGSAAYIHVVGQADSIDEFIECVRVALVEQNLRPIELDDIEPFGATRARSKYFRELRRTAMHDGPVALGRRYLYPPDGADE